MDTPPPPKAAPTPLPELDRFLQPYRSLFQRAQSRQSLDRYVTGLVTDLVDQQVRVVPEEVNLVGHLFQAVTQTGQGSLSLPVLHLEARERLNQAPFLGMLLDAVAK